MNTMELLCIMATVGFFNICCFIIGAKVGQKVVRGETLETPLKSPIKAFEEHKEQVEQKKEQEKLQIILENIDNYDGTGLGQKDIPS